jgi:uncharacterized protein YoxC
MKAVKAILAIGLIIFLIAFLITMVNHYMDVKSNEQTIKNLPKIKKELQQDVKDREDQIKKASEPEDKKEDQE